MNTHFECGGLNSRTVIIIPPCQSADGSSNVVTFDVSSCCPSQRFHFRQVLVQPHIFHLLKKHLKKINSVGKWTSLMPSLLSSSQLQPHGVRDVSRCDNKQLEDVTSVNGLWSPEASCNKSFCSLYSSHTYTPNTPLSTHTHTLDLLFPKQDFNCHKERDSLTMIFARPS